MRKFLFTCVIFLSFVSIENAQWIVVNPFPQTDTLRSVTMTSITTAWSVGNNGTIIKTTDNGETWISQNSGVNWDLRGVFFIDENNGIAVGKEGILRTTNSGTSWVTPTSTDGAILLNSVSFVDANIGVAVGFSGQIFRTADGGENWVKIGSQIKTFNSITFIDANTGIIVGRSGAILKTTDGGVNWFSKASGTTSSLFDVSFSDTNNGMVIGIGVVLKTSDGGETWTSPSNKTFRSVSLYNTNSAIAVSSSGKISNTTDGGTTWSEQTSGTTLTLYSVDFADADNGIAVGYDGVIVRTSNGGVTAVDDSEDGIPLSFSLKQNYPNPFNPSTIIEYSVPQATNVKLEIFNALGQKVATLLNEQISAGTHSVNFDANGLSSGIYLYKLTSENFSQSKKMILMK